jgi:cytochrome c oxidase cbb3-type subunit 3
MSLPDREPSRFARPFSWLLVAMAALLAVGAVLGLRALAHERLETRLLATLPDEVPRDPELVTLATTLARPLYAQHCAICHGTQLQGNPTLGAPCLTDSVWLYGSGTVFDIERTLMYGIRSGHPKGHNLTDMPPLGLTGILTAAQVHDVVQYMLDLGGRAHDGQAALAGRELFSANCADCHGPDARGNADYGAPDLTVRVWNNGGDADSLYRSLYYGRRGVMPGWLGKLPLSHIRALAVYVHTMSHPPATGRDACRQQ